MRQNGKMSKNSKSLGPEKGNDDGRTKKRPFKVGPYRANSAVESYNSKNTAKTTNNRLTRSRSVESTGISKQIGKDGHAASLQLFPINQMQISAQKIQRTNNVAYDGRKVQQSQSTGNNVGQGGPKKRRPFSFSKNFDFNDSAATPGGGEGDEDTPFAYRKYKNIGGSFDEPYQGTPIQQSVKSPRVHFAEPLHSNGKGIPSIEGDDKNTVKISEPTTVMSQHDITENSRSIIVPTPMNTDHQVPDQKKSGSVDRRPISAIKTAPQLDNWISEDELIIAQTDDLISDVTRYFADINSARTKQFPVPLNFSYSPNKNEEETLQNKDLEKFRTLANSSIQSVEGLDDVTCPSIVMMDSARSNFNSSPPVMGHRLFDLSPAGGGTSISRPASASFIRSVSNEDIHGRIALTIKMIEQEEQRELKELLVKASSIPDRLETIEGLGNWETLIQYQYPKVNPPPKNSALSPDFGTRPSSQASSVKFRHNSDENHLHVESNKLPQFQPTQPSQPPIESQQTLKSDSQDVQYSHYSQSRVSNILDSGDVPLLVMTQYSYQGEANNHNSEPGASIQDAKMETSNEKTKKIFSFLDQAEKADRETLLGLSTNSNSSTTGQTGDSNTKKSRAFSNESGSNLSFLQKIDSLITKGSVELAKEHIILERKFEESQQRIQILEETLIHQRELNMRNLRNSERDLKKRLRLQKEEFDAAFARNEALINEMVAEKRILQERCDKLLKNFDETEEKYKEQIKNLQQKHLDEIKRVRKAQITAESVKKQQWMGTKTQEIREKTLIGLEPEVQRIIQRHQQEMSEVRAWHSDELRETEERYQRKLQMQIQDVREKLAKEADEIVSREKEQLTCRFEMGFKEQEQGFELIKRKLLNELQEERERTAKDEMKFKENMQESVRKAQIKGEVELDNLKEEYESKIANLERRHTSEIKSMKDIHEAETKTLISKLTKQFETEVKEKENDVIADLKMKMEHELKQRENRLKDEFEKVRKEEEASSDIRFKRMQEKFTLDIQEMDQTEKDLKSKFNQAKSQLLLVEEQVYSLRAALSLKEKQNTELQETNMKMLEERTNLTSVIRREFSSQIECLENEIKGMRSNLVEIQSKHKLELEQKCLETEKLCHDKDAELDKIGDRVQQTIERKDETIHGLQKQVEKLNFQIQHLEGLLEEQRRSLVDNMTKSVVGANKRK